MSILIDLNICTSCGACVDICPGDLITLHAQHGKAYIRDPRDCWDCMCCVKACPESAIETKIPFQMANFGAHLRPKVFPDRIHWTCIDPQGRAEEFVIKTKEI